MQKKETKKWQDELEEELSPETVRKRDYPMKKLTTLRIGGPADFYVEPSCTDDLRKVLSHCAGRGIPFFLLGRGSNLVVRDGGIRGVVCSLRHSFFSQTEVKNGRLLIHAGAGATLRQIAQFAQANALAGLEFLEGIPGSLGGGLRMNAGAYKSSLKDVVESVSVLGLDGVPEEVPGENIQADYRCCAFFENKIALSAVLRAYSGVAEQIRERMTEMRDMRLKTQTQSPSAGCAFKNPPGYSAGRLIDSLGMKGFSVGGAQVSDKHANFLINKNNATSQNILELIQIIQERVLAECGVSLETEVMIVGEDAGKQIGE